MVLCMSENMSFWKTGEKGYVVFMSFLDQIYVGWKNTLSAHWFPEKKCEKKKNPQKIKTNLDDVDH